MYTRFFAEAPATLLSPASPLRRTPVRPLIAAANDPLPTLYDIWKPIREELRSEVPDFTFHIWLDPLELAGTEQRTLFVRAPDHIRTWVRDRYLPVVRAAAARGFREDAVVEIVDEGWPGESDGTSPGGAFGPPVVVVPWVAGRTKPRRTRSLGRMNRIA